MKFTFREITGWPKLAWVAVSPDKSDTLEILHGSCVEVTDDWCVEAAWAGPFAQGDFDLTDMVFGTGIRLRNGEAVFVSSGSVMDRLFFGKDKGRWFFSNSFAAILAVSGLSLLDNHPYKIDMHSISKGLNHYLKTIPLKDGNIEILYFNNLAFDGSHVREVTKPDSARDFKNFDDYFGYLSGVAKRIGENICASDRSTQIVPFAPVSSGYDSPVVAIVARHAGCRHSATIKSARSVLRKRSDSGEEIAKRLNLECPVYERNTSEFEHEEYVWAVRGDPDDLNMTIFDYPGSLTLLFTGIFGDTVWSRDFSRPLEKEPMIGYDGIGLGLSEFRLLKGMFHCPVPLMGIRHIGAIRNITSSAEMAPYTLNTDYDKPIARRIVESAGVPRGSFALQKSATSLDPFIRYPRSKKAQESFKNYARSRGIPVPNACIFKAMELIKGIDIILISQIRKRKDGWQWLRLGRQPKASSFLFHWAIQEITQQYRASL